MQRKEKRILGIVFAVVLVVVCAVLIIRLPSIKQARNSQQTSTNPAFDTSAVAGVPQITDKGSNYNSLELPISDGDCSLSMDATPLLKDGKLYLFLTADEGNSTYISIVLYNQDDVEVGRSGLLKAGEYLECVDVANTVTSGAQIKAKILTFETDTYYSLGSAGATLNVR